MAGAAEAVSAGEGVSAGFMAAIRGTAADITARAGIVPGAWVVRRIYLLY